MIKQTLCCWRLLELRSRCVRISQRYYFQQEHSITIQRFVKRINLKNQIFFKPVALCLDISVQHKAPQEEGMVIKMKILSVDFGDSHTGLAVCDRTETISSPIGIIHERNFEMCIEKTASAVIEYEVGEVIVGNPINMNGTYGPRSEKCTLFADELKKLVSVPVKMWDERSSTVTAHNYMNEVNKRGKKRKAVIDAVAAAVILDSYLLYRANHKDTPSQ